MDHRLLAESTAGAESSGKALLKWVLKACCGGPMGSPNHLSTENVLKLLFSYTGPLIFSRWKKLTSFCTYIKRRLLLRYRVTTRCCTDNDTRYPGVHMCIFIKLTSRSLPSLARIMNLDFVTVFLCILWAVPGHGTVEVGRGLWRCSSPSPCSEQQWQAGCSSLRGSPRLETPQPLRATRSRVAYFLCSGGRVGILTFLFADISQYP